MQRFRTTQQVRRQCQQSCNGNTLLSQLGRVAFPPLQIRTRPPTLGQVPVMTFHTQSIRLHSVAADVLVRATDPCKLNRGQPIDIVTFLCTMAQEFA